MTKTTLPKVEEIKRKWYEIDATDIPLGRLATRVATILRGKHRPTFTPHMDTGDFVVVINCEKIKLSGRKLDQKQYFHFSGYPGGLKKTTLSALMEKHPERVVERAVRQMLSPNRLRKPILKRLRAMKGNSHNYKIDEKLS